MNGLKLPEVGPAAVSGQFVAAHHATIDQRR